MSWRWLTLLLALCPLLAGAQEDYARSVDAWHARRVASLTKPDGWLSLAGLFWLAEGENTFGSEAGNRMVFPRGPARMGAFYLEHGAIRVRIESGVDVAMGGQPCRQAPVDLTAAEGAVPFTWGPLKWYPIQRNGRWGVRLKDATSPALAHFRGIERYAVDPAWRVQAHLEPYVPPRKIAVPNILGAVDEEECPGALVFTMAGRTCRLDPVRESGEEGLFVIFADASNGHGSYGAGRFLNTDPPDAQGRVSLDFNRAYNPPCAFTPYATCPRPPAQNRLPFAVPAGERAYAHE